MRLFEWHPTDGAQLQQFAKKDRRIIVRIADGFAGLKSVLPPAPRRALVLIDPPYETKQDYQHVIATLQDALSRFETGIYLLWYPLLQRVEAMRLPAQLQALPAKRWLHVQMKTRLPVESGYGLYGSGLFVMNPPWLLADTLRTLLPALTELLREYTGAAFTMDLHGYS